MAKIKFSALVSEMRNKLNGSVMSKNRYGNYVRNKVTPVNPQTSFQQNVRALLSSLSSAWTGLTEAQRNGWRALAQAIPFTDIFGDQKFLDGKAMYIKLNSNLVNAGEAAVSAAPAQVAIPEFAIDDLVAEETDGSLVTLDAAFNPAVIPAGFVIAIYATPGVKPGVNFVKNLYRFIGTVDALAAGEADLLEMWNDRFGGVIPGQRIFVRAALISTDSGQAGIPTEQSAVIVTAE